MRPFVVVAPLIYVLVIPLYRLFDPVAVIVFGIALIALCVGIVELSHPTRPITRVNYWVAQAIIGIAVLALGAILLFELPTLVPRSDALDRSCRTLQASGMSAPDSKATLGESASGQIRRSSSARSRGW